MAAGPETQVGARGVGEAQPPPADAPAQREHLVLQRAVVQLQHGGLVDEIQRAIHRVRGIGDRRIVEPVQVHGAPARPAFHHFVALAGRDGPPAAPVVHQQDEDVRHREELAHGGGFGAVVLRVGGASVRLAQRRHARRPVEDGRQLDRAGALDFLAHRV